MGVSLPYDTDVQLSERIGKEWPHLIEYDVIAQAVWESFGGEGNLSDHPFESIAKGEFYLANSICRASDTMRQCSKAFQVRGQEYLRAAE